MCILGTVNGRAPDGGGASRRRERNCVELYALFHWTIAPGLMNINVAGGNQYQRQDSTRKKGLALLQGLIYERKFEILPFKNL
jgi:hypothetical protein